MLPDIRAVIAAIVTAVGLLTISFGMVAAFRVAQDDRAGFLHAELAQRGRQPLPASAAPHAILIVDTSPMTVPSMPAAELPVPVAANAAPLVIETKAEATQTSDAPVTISVAETSRPVTVAAMSPVSEAPAIQEREIALPSSGQLAVGGPFAEVAPTSAQNSLRQHNAAVQKAERAAAIKKARATRLARARRIAARRAAAARRAQQTPTAAFGWNTPQTNYSFDSFNNGGFPGGLGNAAASTKTRQPASGL